MKRVARPEKIVPYRRKFPEPRFHDVASFFKIKVIGTHHEVIDFGLMPLSPFLRNHLWRRFDNKKKKYASIVPLWENAEGWYYLPADMWIHIRMEYRYSGKCKVSPFRIYVSDDTVRVASAHVSLV